MAYTVELFNFSKRENSTAIPQTAPALSASCDLKDGSTILSPTVLLAIDSGQISPSFNYARIPEFSRYYRVRDIRWSFGLWEIDLIVDSLASWRTAIRGTRTYVYRADTGTSVSSFSDNMYPYTNYLEKINSIETKHFTTVMSLGTYVIGVLSKGTSGIGGVKYYALQHTSFAALCNLLFDDTTWLDIDDISDNLQKALINPIQYITSCRWYPIRQSSFTGTAVTSIPLGWWSIAVGGIEIGTNNMTLSNSFSIAIPKHPAYSTYGREMLLAPATRYTAVIPPWGQFVIDPLNVVNAGQLVVSYDLDIATGNAIAYFGTDEYDGDTTRRVWFDTRLGALGVTIPVVQSTQDFVGAAYSALMTAGSLATGNILGAIGGVVNVAESQVPRLTYTGEVGNLSTINRDPMIMGEFLMPAQRSFAEFGTPVFEMATLSAFSGYVQCHGDFSAPCTDSELSEIRQHMETGFFVE